MGFVGVPELIVIAVILLLLFGAKRIPEVGRSLGRGAREFKDSVTGKDEDTVPPPALPARDEDAENPS